MAPYSIGSLFKHSCVTLGSMHFCAILLAGMQSIVLYVPIFQAGLAGLDDVVESSCR
jgi:hypothetical protein